jgi:hypothetical protein
LDYDLLPLTLALSLGEREPHSRVVQVLSTTDSSSDWGGFSLSPQAYDYPQCCLCFLS